MLTNFKKGIWKKLNVLLVMVLIGGFAYYSLYIKNPTYTSSTSFVISDLKKDSVTPGIATMFTGLPADSKKDSMLFQDYVLSSKNILAINNLYKLKEVYLSSTSNLFDEYFVGTSDEEFIALFKENIQYSYNDDSGSTTLSFSFYDKVVAQEVVSYLLARGTELLNDANKDTANYELSFISEQTEKQKIKVDTLLETLKSYERKVKVVNSEVFVSSKQELLSSLKMKLISKSSELKSLSFYMNKKSTQIRSIKNEIIGLNLEIKKIENQLYGKDIQYTFELERIQANLSFEQGVYEKALGQLTAAKIEVLKDAKRLSMISEPSLADGMDNPNKIKDILTASIIILFFWWIFTTLIHVIRDHKE